ncbi:helix-turn-helix domain-containing protein [Microbacterium enclense]|uniref:helix-turn-helix domain-containing protein n=1 Tax=Microbacterium enclense TaxID=993073 RepID=UPI003F7FFF55
MERRTPATSVDLGPTGDTVRRNVRRVRQDQECTLRDLSERLAENGYPMAQSALSKIENGTRRVDVDDMMALAVALGVSPVALLLPASRTPDDSVEVSGWSTDTARSMWKWVLGISDLVDLGYIDRNAMHQHFPLWVEQTVRSWASPEPDDIFHPHGD